LAKMKGTWRRLASSEGLQRSSHVVAASHDELVVFGGEVKPRQPVDNKLYAISLKEKSTEIPDVKILDAPRQSPSPRVGSASTTLKNRAYLFSGRGGEAMSPIDEEGAIWMLNLSSKAWSYITPNEGSKYPQARSYHALTSDGNDTLYLHAGCPESGRLSDLWCFQISLRRWTQLASAPDPPRGGASVALKDESLYRMNGFDGKTEQGGSLDVYDLESNCWTQRKFTADDREGPSPRSVSALLPLDVGGKSMLITLFGEQDPSSLGHQGAGKMKGDVWAYDLSSQNWTEVQVDGERPEPRGWFAAEVTGHDQEESIFVHGGLSESNARLGDIWVLRLDGA
ncbi:galactose oxidase, partial [Aulographum hederae CBS 113979]